MGEEEQQKQADPPAPASSSQPDSSPPFDPSRKCLAYCQELLEFQKKWEEPFLETKAPDDSRKEMTRLPKRLKKTR